MEKYVVEITEYLIKAFTIEANSEEEAISIAESNYKNSHPDYILTSDDYAFYDAQISYDYPDE